MKIVLLFMSIALSFASCTIDNYDMPDLTLSGKIIDAQTSEPVESGGMNAGSILRLYQDNSPQPLVYRTFPDGTFKNTRVFPGNYAYTVEGPFTAPSDPVSLVISRNTDIEVKVTPNVRLKLTLISASGTSAMLKIEYEKVNMSQTLAHLALVWSTFSDPNVQTFSGGNLDLENVESMDLTSGEKMYTISDLKPGTTYYFRAAARTNNPGNYYNYSTQIELQTQ